jgi:hypothetical protein
MTPKVGKQGVALKPFQALVAIADRPFQPLQRQFLPTAFEPAIEGLRSRGFGRSELSIRELWSLSATATLVTGVAIRYKLDGHELERVGVTYVLHKADTGWKIAVLIAHDTEIARQASVVTSKLAIEGHLKTGHRTAARTCVVFTASEVGAARILGPTNGRPCGPPPSLVWVISS